MENTTSNMNSEMSQPSFPPELWIDVVNNLRINDQHPIIFPDYNRPDKLVLGRLSLCNTSFRQLLEPMVWEMVLLSPDGNGWSNCIARANKPIQSDDRASWVKYLTFGKLKRSGSHTITPDEWNTIEALFQRLPNLYGVCIINQNITSPIATILFQLQKLRCIELRGVSCVVDCSNFPLESFRITELRVICKSYTTDRSTLIPALARGNCLSELMINIDRSWYETRGILLDHCVAPSTRLKTLALSQQIAAADLTLLSTFTTQFAAVIALELYPPQMLSMRDMIALQSVPIPDTVFPNLQSFRGTLYMAKGLHPKRPIGSLCILSSLPHEGLVHLTTGSVPLTTVHVHTARYTEGCLRDVAQTFLNLEDLSIAIKLNEDPVSVLRLRRADLSYDAYSVRTPGRSRNLNL